jgi:hypothetical protein
MEMAPGALPHPGRVPEQRLLLGSGLAKHQKKKDNPKRGSQDGGERDSWEERMNEPRVEGFLLL